MGRFNSVRKMSYDTSDLAKTHVLLDATRFALNTPKKRYQFSEFCSKHNFPNFSSIGRYNQDYKNLNGEWHILLKRYPNKVDLINVLESRIESLSAVLKVNDSVLKVADSVEPISVVVEYERTPNSDTIVATTVTHNKINANYLFTTMLLISVFYFVRACFI